MTTAIIGTRSGVPVARSAARLTNPGPGKLKLTRRGRVVLTSLAAVPLVVAAVFGALNAGAASASGPGAPAHFAYVTVHAGQSLWSISESVAPNADPRDVIAAIVTLNGLHDATVVPGERLAIPSQYDAGQH